MKHFKLFVMTVIAISLAACGNGGKINPTSKKINGPLGKFFEVVERDYKLSDDQLGVEFKRISEGGPNDASWDTHPTFLVELQDEDGNVISTANTDVVFTEEQLETIFSLAVDETASITFKFDKTKGAALFKVSSKWDAENEKKTDSAESVIEAIHQAAYINDPDGYTNVRSMPDGKAKIVGKIVDGEEFYFDEVSGSNWVKIYRSADAAADCIGYMHSSRVMPVGDEIAAMTEDDEADKEDALISSSKIGPEEAIAAFASFVSMMEGVKTLTDSKAEAIDDEFKRLENLYGKLKENEFSIEQQKRIRELRRKAEKERERLTKSYNPFSDGEDSDDDDDDF